MAANTTSSMSASLPVLYERELLDRLVKRLVLEPLGTKSLNIPTRNGQQVNWLRYAERHVSATSDYLLAEGVIPTEVAITVGNVTATALQYGRYAIITDKLEFTARDPILDNVNDVLGDEAAELVDTLIRNELDSNLPNQFANGKPDLANTGVNDIMTVKEGLKAMIGLEANNVVSMPDGSFVCVVSAKSKGDIMNDTNQGGWTDVHKYSQQEDILNGEIGKAYNVRYVMSQNISSTASGTLGGATVFSNLLMGNGCFGVARLGNENFKRIVQSPGGIADPLEQINTVGFKILGFVPKYLGGASNQTADRGVRIRAGSPL